MYGWNMDSVCRPVWALGKSCCCFWRGACASIVLKTKSIITLSMSYNYFEITLHWSLSSRNWMTSDSDKEMLWNFYHNLFDEHHSWYGINFLRNRANTFLGFGDKPTTLRNIPTVCNLCLWIFDEQLTLWLNMLFAYIMTCLNILKI